MHAPGSFATPNIYNVKLDDGHGLPMPRAVRQCTRETTPSSSWSSLHTPLFKNNSRAKNCGLQNSLMDQSLRITFACLLMV